MAYYWYPFDRYDLQKPRTSTRVSLYGNQRTGTRHGQANVVQDLLRLERPRMTPRPEDMLVRRQPFATAPVLKRQLLPNRLMSSEDRLLSTGMNS